MIKKKYCPFYRIYTPNYLEDILMVEPRHQTSQGKNSHNSCAFYLELSLKAGWSRVNGWRRGNAAARVWTPYYWNRLTDIRAWISNYLRSSMWHVVTHPWLCDQTVTEVRHGWAIYYTPPVSVQLTFHVIIPMVQHMQLQTQQLYDYPYNCNAFSNHQPSIVFHHAI